MDIETAVEDIMLILHGDEEMPSLAIREVLERLVKAEREKAWQPIETAPKDGSLVLTWGDARAQYAVSYWDEDDKEWYTDFREKGNISQVYATHWMPLPSAPALAEATP